VVTDLFTNYLFEDLGKMAESLPVAKEGLKLCIDGTTKVLFGLMDGTLRSVFGVK
jgi:hypothetical protein